MNQPTFTPTPEQADFVTRLREGRPIVCQAVAGSGKTTTLMLADRALGEMGKRGIYLAFNKAIVSEVTDEFYNCEVMTFHSLAYKIVNASSQYGPLLLKMNSDYTLRKPKDIANALGLKERFYYWPREFEEMEEAGITPPDKKRYYTSVRLVSEALHALSNWCDSAEAEVNEEFVRIPDSISTRDHKSFCETVAALAKRLWHEDILNPRGKIDFSHDYYLKLASLMRPLLVEVPGLNLRPGDVLMFDEAQDARPSMTSIVYDQQLPYRYAYDYTQPGVFDPERGGLVYQQLRDGQGNLVTPYLQAVVVGDSSQAIYGSFTGARDALPKFSAIPGAANLSLTTSFRFGEQVAQYANMVLDLIQAPNRVVGNPDKQSTVNLYIGPRPSEWQIYASNSQIDIDGEDGYFHNMNSEDEESRPSFLPDDIDAYVVRTNSQLLDVAEKMREKGLSYAIVADVRDIEYTVNDFERLLNGKRAWGNKMKDFSNYQEMMDYANDKTSPDKQLAQLLKNINRTGVESVRDIIGESVPEDLAHVTISTAHKAKGRQWNRVALYGDEFDWVPGTNGLVPTTAIIEAETGQFRFHDREALMLLYVAATRAKEALYVPARVDAALRWLSKEVKDISGVWPSEREVVGLPEITSVATLEGGTDDPGDDVEGGESGDPADNE